MGFYKVTINGSETIKEDYNKIINQLRIDTNNALNQMGKTLIASLQNHINIDFYDKYDPKSYPRRKDFPQYGKSLLSEDYMNIDVTGTMLAMEYLPRGEHSGKMKDTLNWKKKQQGGNAPIKPNPLHGNELIARLQTGKGYDWKLKNGDYPPRPFWNLFIEDVEKNFEGEFIATMQSKGYDFKQDGSLILDGNEKL